MSQLNHELWKRSLETGQISQNLEDLENVPSVPVPTGLLAHNGSSITRKSATRSNHILVSLPGQVEALLRSGTGNLGAVRDLRSEKPLLYLDFPELGSLKMEGFHVYPETSFMMIQYKGGKPPKSKKARLDPVECRSISTSALVFSKWYWIGKREDNPKETPLPLPQEVFAQASKSTASSARRLLSEDRSFETPKRRKLAHRNAAIASEQRRRAAMAELGLDEEGGELKEEGQDSESGFAPEVKQTPRKRKSPSKPSRHPGESEEDDSDMDAQATSSQPSRSSSRAAARRRVSYAEFSDSEEDDPEFRAKDEEEEEEYKERDEEMNHPVSAETSSHRRARRRTPARRAAPSFADLLSQDSDDEMSDGSSEEFHLGDDDDDDDDSDYSG